MRRPDALWKQARGSAVFIGMAGVAVRQGGNLILLPIALEKLSSAEMALWAVFVTVGLIGNLADFGFGQAITRVYSYFWAGSEEYDPQGLKEIPKGRGPNLARLQDLTAGVRRLYRWLSVLAAILLFGVGTWFVAPSKTTAAPSLEMNAQAPTASGSETSAGPAGSAHDLNADSSARDIYAREWKLWLLWLAYVGSVLYSLGSSYWTLACQGINQVREVQRANLWAGLAYAASASAMLLFGWGLIAMVGATMIRAVLTARICRRAYGRSVPQTTQPAVHEKIDFLPRIWPSAWKFGVIALAVYFANQGTVLISRWYLSDAATASYFVTMQVVNVIANVASLCLQVKFPQLTILRAQGALREMSILFARRLGWTVSIYIVLASLFLLFGNRALAWRDSLRESRPAAAQQQAQQLKPRHEPTKFLPTAFLLIVLIYAGQQLFTTQFIWLTYTENVVPFYRISICTGVGLVLLSIPMTKHFGLWGLVTAPVLAAIPTTSWYPVWRGFKGQALGVAEFLRAAAGQRILNNQTAKSGKSL